MKNLRKTFAWVLILGACGVVLEIDISEDQISLFAPADSANIQTAEVTFSWERLEGATDYRIVVVSPSFSDLQNTLVDTVLLGERNTTFSTVFEEGEYQWSAVARNSAYQTTPMIRSFLVLKGVDISDRQVQLFAPSDGVTIEGFDVTFSWERILDVEDIDEYQLKVVSPSFAEAQRVAIDTVLKGDSITSVATVLREGDYEWTVLAKSGIYVTQPQERQFSVIEDPVDQSIKNETIVATSPPNGGKTTDLVISFRWNEILEASSYRISAYFDEPDRTGPVFENAVTNLPRFTWTFDERANYVWDVYAVNSRDSTSIFSFTFEIEEEPLPQ